MIATIHSPYSSRKMSKIDSEKLKKRLTWITPSDREQADWIRKYLESHRDPAPWFSPHGLKTLTSKEYVEAFVSAVYHAVDGDSVDYDRVEGVKSLCNKLKAAWTSKQRRKKNTNKTETAFTLSKKGRSQLEKLAKNQNCSFSQVVDALLKSSKDIQSLERKLKSEDSEQTESTGKLQPLSKLLAGEIESSKVEDNAINQLHESHNRLNDELSIAREQNDKLVTQANEHEQEIVKLNEEITQLRLENEDFRAQKSAQNDMISIQPQSSIENNCNEEMTAQAVDSRKGFDYRKKYNK
ncbi:hypothetical protein VCRA2113O117_70084 [Vibrio crassostreae]|nr:hypothetical protein VCRA2110O113_100105 [Vibrio crassostreae]CAK2573759.1 hypothetical protein VCRA2119O125_100105 [Vibrio crassostreae]CAK3046599.1 hypothetical protein VCRA2113O117_70084 [Vibrio crassostreae]CAK3127629.1 hypothetical protein VCRA2122O129_100085 [Vibrio crassostreae]